MNPEKTAFDVIACWEETRARGQAISPEELCRDRPELLEEVRAGIQRLTADPRAPNTTWADVAVDRPEASSSPVPAIAGYEILGELGRGGMGVVYRARQLGLNRTVALKMILAGVHARDEDFVRFLGEAEAVAALAHPGVVQIYDIGSHADVPYFSMEFVAGGSLAAKVREQPLPAGDAAVMVERIARAVAAAHERGIVHRDLKPENVLLTPDGWPKITDFGLAKKIESDSGLTRTGAIMGTPSYMAPEQAGGRTKEIGPATDVWALGAILYRLVTGRPPFQAASNVETVLQVMNEEPVSPSRLLPKFPRDLETICLKCLNKEPKKRYPSAGQLAEDLRRFNSRESILARPTGRIEHVWNWARRNPAVAGLLMACATVLLLGTGTSTALAIRSQRALEREQAAVQRSHEILDKFMRYVVLRDPEFAKLPKKERNERFDALVDEFLKNERVTPQDFREALALRDPTAPFVEGLAKAGEAGTQPASSYAPGFFGD